MVTELQEKAVGIFPLNAQEALGLLLFKHISLTVTANPAQLSGPQSQRKPKERKLHKDLSLFGNWDRPFPRHG